MADGTRTYSFVLDGTWQLEASWGKQQLVEAFYIHDDTQTISTCSYISCRETPFRPTITDSTRFLLKQYLLKPADKHDRPGIV